MQKLLLGRRSEACLLSWMLLLQLLQILLQVLWHILGAGLLR
jgi:hypothetical protein